MKFYSSVKKSLKNTSLLALCLLPSVGALAQTDAQNWPAKAITIVVPGSPGGTSDIPIRLIAPKISERLDQTVVVDNRPGSGGILGAQAMLRSPADGYSLLIGNTGSNAINYSAYKNLPYKASEMKPLIDIVSFPNVLVVNSSSPIQSVAELIEAMKKPSAKFSFSSAGIGQTTHLTGELFKIRTKTEALHIPYKGASPATMALLSNEVSFQFDNLTQALPHIKAGKLRALAITSPERNSMLPDVPTMAEAGVKDFVAMGWLGMFVKEGTPDAIVAKLHEEFKLAMQDPEINQKIRALGGEPGKMSQAEFEKFVNAESKLWADTIKAANIKLD